MEEKIYEIMGYSSQEEMKKDVNISIARIAKYFQEHDEDFLEDIGLIDIYINAN